MKKLIVLFIALILLGGCAQKKQMTPAMRNISFTAHIDYDKQKYVCDVALSEDALNLVVSEPKEICGLTLKINKNGTTAEFKGISYDFDVNSLPQGAIAEILLQIFNDVSQKTVKIGEENAKISGEVNGISYQFIFAPTGLPISLTIDNPDMIIKFNNVTLK